MHCKFLELLSTIHGSFLKQSGNLIGKSKRLDEFYTGSNIIS